jgi:long-chain acyl-CoA synthetase
MMPTSWLVEKMKEWQDDTALVWHDEGYSYSEVVSATESWGRILIEEGVRPGNVVALEGDYSLNACSLLLALIQRKAIVVPLAVAVKSLREEFLQVVEVQFVFSFDDHDNWRIDRRNAMVANYVTQELIKIGDPGLVLFSSGSTGRNKGALHNFAKLMEKFKKPRHKMCTINFLLFDHIGGINTLFYTLSNGGTVVTTGDRNADTICKLIEKYKIELLPTTPTFLNLLLLSEAYKNYNLTSLKLITYGTEVMPKSTLQKIQRVFPNVRLLQTYGLSELGILRSKSKDSGSLWMKVGGEGFETKVVDGILWIRAESAMIGYLNAPSPFTEDGWFITGDAVERDGDYIRILGRKSEVINVGGEKVYPAEVESLIQTMEGVVDVAVSSESNPITGQIVKARVKLNTGEGVAEFKKRMREFCRDRLPNYKIPQKLILASENLHSERFKKIRRQNEG